MNPLIPILLKTVGPILIGHALNRLAPQSPEPHPEEVQQVIRETADHPEVQSALASKPWYRSKTVWSSLAVTVVSGAAILGATISAGDIEEIMNHLDMLATAVFGLVSIYGRITARGPLR